MKMSKEEFVERYKQDKAKKEADKHFRNKAADDFRYGGLEKNIRAKQRLNRKYY